MKRILVLTLGLLVAPTLISAQVEIGLDAGFQVLSFDDVGTFSIDSENGFTLPGQWARVGFAAGEQIIVETVIGFEWYSQGDESGSELLLIPGINYLFGEQFYVRGEAGLQRSAFDPGTGGASSMQYLFGGAVGMRRPLGDSALLRLEAGVDRYLENVDDGRPAITAIRGGVGVSAVIN